MKDKDLQLLCVSLCWNDSLYLAIYDSNLFTTALRFTLLE